MSKTKRFQNFASSLIGLIVIVIGVGLSMGSGMAWAEKNDRDRPLHIEADRLDHDENKKTSYFTGRVMASKGTLVMRGHSLEIRLDNSNNQYGVLLPEPGALAYFRQKRDGLDEFMEAEAERIEYDGRLDRFTLVGRAELRRLRGSQRADEIQGQVIVYDNIKEQFTVDGKSEGGQPNAPRSRVRAVIAPKANPDR